MVALIELGHPIHDGMSAYPGLPDARVRQVLSHADSRARYDGRAEFCLTALELACNTGTYLDSPWHRHPDAPDVADLPLRSVAALPGVVVDPVGPGRPVDIEVDERSRGAAVLVRTGWSERWGTPDYWTRGPCLSEAAVTALVAARPALVGVDFANVDDLDDASRQAHTRLLGTGIVVVEHMTGLHQLPPHGFTLHCAPLAVHGAASVPVRPYAVLGDETC